MNKQFNNHPLENKIHEVMQAVEPRQDFSEALLQDILRKQPVPATSSARNWNFWHSRWAPASLLLVV